jgi:Ca-activated chloride channel family protein
LILRNPQALALLLLLPVLFLIWRLRGRRVLPFALMIRFAIVFMLILGLSDPIFGTQPQAEGPLVILADQSDSLTEAGKRAIRQRLDQLSEASDQQAKVLLFGADVVAPPAGQLSATQQSTTLPDPSGSDLATALREARSLLPGGGRIILLSDGAQTNGDALAEAQIAATSAITIDVVPILPEAVPDVRISAMSVPSLLRVGEEFPVQIQIESSGPDAPTIGNLRVWAGDTLVREEQVDWSASSLISPLRLTASEPGVVRLRAEISAGPDSFPRNNNAAATTLVAPPPRVLLVEGQANNAAELRLALRRVNIESDLIPASALPNRLSDLAPYEGIVLLDVSATNLTLEQMTTVREFVRSDGKGLVAAGGRSSYSLGSYKGTPLEQVLPVTADPKPRPQRPDVALLLIIDQSASMGSSMGISKFDMAKEAAILSSEALDSEDRIGILAFDTSQSWIVPFQQVGTGLSLGQIQDRISNIPLGGGTNIYDALNVGLVQLVDQPSSVRHVVLLTDGRSFTNDRFAYQNLVSLGRQRDITLSTIAIGDDSDTELLREIAGWGGGRYYFASEPEDIPRLTLLESSIARTDPAVESMFQAQLAAPHPILRDFAPSEMPQLDGYVATTVKPEAELVLESPDADPILATWQYGLGRSVAWLPSVDAPWADLWDDWDDFDRFWGQMIRYTLPAPDSGSLQVRVERAGEFATVTVESRGPGGQPLDLADTEAQFTLPDGSQRMLSLPQIAPGRYSQVLRLPSDGPYAVTVQQSKDGQDQIVRAGFVQPVPAEYQPNDTDGPALLEEIAAATGGQIVREQSVIERQQRASGEVTSLWPWFVGIALILWLVEIAIRRGRLFLSASR